MNSYTYIPNGQIDIKGCSENKRSIFVFYKWGERSVVYVKPKAIRGILERIAVKRVIMNFKLGKYPPIYVDNLNSLYNEDELISETEAKGIVRDYIKRQRSLIEASIGQCFANTI